jgi:hypothetical protein
VSSSIADCCEILDLNCLDAPPLSVEEDDDDDDDDDDDPAGADAGLA